MCFCMFIDLCLVFFSCKLPIQMLLIWTPVFLLTDPFVLLLSITKPIHLHRLSFCFVCYVVSGIRNWADSSIFLWFGVFSLGLPFALCKAAKVFSFSGFMFLPVLFRFGLFNACFYMVSGGILTRFSQLYILESPFLN